MLTKSRSRLKKGTLQAEYAMTMYVFFLFFAIPFIDYSVLGLRIFFLWFAANQAVMIGSKAHTLVQKVTIGTTTYDAALALSASRAYAIQTAFPGISWDTTKYPAIFIDFVPLATNPADKQAVISYGTTLGSKTGMTAAGTTLSPIAQVPDQNLYVTEYRCVIAGECAPFIPVPLLGNVPGLSTTAKITVSAQAQVENPPGLTQ